MLTSITPNVMTYEVTESRPFNGVLTIAETVAIFKNGCLWYVIQKERHLPYHFWSS